jgi:hypothetical protein
MECYYEGQNDGDQYHVVLNTGLSEEYCNQVLDVMCAQKSKFINAEEFDRTDIIKLPIYDRDDENEIGFIEFKKDFLLGNNPETIMITN